MRLRVDAAHAQMRGAGREGQLERALSTHLGRAVRLSIEVGPLDGAESPTQRARRELAERRGAAARVLDRDPTVKHLRDAFSASVVEESVRAGGETDGET